jgi:glycosyltransferase involved in cell wall biosynthesis
MRLLHIAPSYRPAYEYGGVIESVARLCEGLAEAGHVVDVFTTTANGRSELNVTTGISTDVRGVNVIYFKRITKDPTHVSPGLWLHLWKYGHRYDTIHIHSWWNVLVVFAAWICIIKKWKIVISPRGMLSEYILTTSHVKVKKWIHHLLGRKALLKSVLHATAQSEYDECIRLVDGWKGFVLPNILLLSDVQVKRSINPTFTLLFLSRIHQKKGLELLFDALVGLPFGVKLNIAGTGDAAYINELKRYADTLHIADKVVWLGWIDRDEKFLELMKSDCFILTSHNENFANCVIESLHVGTPVIISEQVGLAPFVRAQNMGWITDLSVQSVQTAIADAQRDSAKRTDINQNGRNIIETFFKQDVLVKQYAENYGIA